MINKKSIIEKIRAIWYGWRNEYLYRTGKLPRNVRALMDDRLRVCKLNVCQKLKYGVCTACGCPISKKTKSLTEECPENLWNPSIYSLPGVPDFILLGEIPEQLQQSFHLFNKKGTRESGKQLAIMAQVEEPWARKDVWDEFLAWWEEQIKQ